VLTLEVVGIDKLEKSLASLPNRVHAGVKVFGTDSKGASNVVKALIWEWGSARMKQPGPKTLWSVNPAGKPAILTLTAPLGFIRVNQKQYVQIAKDEFSKTDWSKLSLNQYLAAVIDVAAAVSRRCASLISDTAPIDEGDLRAHIVPVQPGDPLLQKEEALQTIGDVVSAAYDLGTEWNK
jgi:hypothetical protein